MGSWVSASFGYGIALPDPDEEEYVPTDWVLSVQPKWWEPGESPDWDEVAKVLGLTHDIGYVQDWGQRSVLFAGKPLTTYETVKSFTQSEMTQAVTPNADVLRDAAEKIEIPFEPAYFLVVSYG